MADGVKISSLAEATDAQMTDAGLIETAVADTGSSTGFSSKKSSFGRLAGYILNKFSGLSLAGASQTVKAAIDKVFTNSYMDVGTTIESSTNLNTITTVGKYSARTAVVSSLLNCPTTTGFSMYVEIFTTSGKKQTIIDNNGATYTRINIVNNTTSWTDWAKQPTASDIGNLSSLTTTAKTNLVAAVNEVNAAINSLVDGNEVSY